VNLFDYSDSEAATAFYRDRFEDAQDQEPPDRVAMRVDVATANDFVAWLYEIEEVDYAEKIGVKSCQVVAIWQDLRGLELQARMNAAYRRFRDGRVPS
jgi:hypothetical protein